MNILAIDPGNIYSAYCVMDTETFRPLEFAKCKNEALREKLRKAASPGDAPAYERVVIERVQSYGMAVGIEVFATCEWIGRFTEAAEASGVSVAYIDRMEEKQLICHDSRARDSNIRRALIDRFAQHDLKNGKGTKDKPDFFHGFGRDCWSAFAVGYTHIVQERIRKEASGT